MVCLCLCLCPGIAADGMSVAASAMTAGSAGTRTKASSSSVLSRSYGGDVDPVDRHHSTDEEDRDYLDLSGDNDRDLDLDEHTDQVTLPSTPSLLFYNLHDLTWMNVSSSPSKKVENRRPKPGRHHSNSSRNGGPRSATRTGAGQANSSSKANTAAASSSIRVNVPSTNTTHTPSQSDPSQQSAQAATTLLMAKLSAEKKDLTEEIQRLQSSEGSLRDRVQRADEKIGELKKELSESKRTAEQVARKLKEKDTELARTILEHDDARKSLVSTVSTLESRLAQADEWGDKTTEKEDALAAAVADRLSLQAQVGDLLTYQLFSGLLSVGSRRVAIGYYIYR